jgi:hypothetical protein
MVYYRALIVIFRSSSERWAILRPGQGDQNGGIFMVFSPVLPIPERPAPVCGGGGIGVAPAAAYGLRAV